MCSQTWTSVLTSSRSLNVLILKSWNTTWPASPRSISFHFIPFYSHSSTWWHFVQKMLPFYVSYFRSKLGAIYFLNCFIFCHKIDNYFIVLLFWEFTSQSFVFIIICRQFRKSYWNTQTGWSVTLKATHLSITWYVQYTALHLYAHSFWASVYIQIFIFFIVNISV